MKLLYIYIGSGKRLSSIKEKILQIVEELNQHEIEVKGLFFTTEVHKKERLNEHVELIPVSKTKAKYFHTIKKHRRSIRRVHDYLKEHHDEYDAIYFRYPGGCDALYSLVKEFGDKIVFEHNSKETEELRLLSKDVKFGIRPTNLLTWIQSVKIQRAEQTWGGRVLAKTAMGIAVTEDMAEYEIDRARGKYKCLAVANGLKVNGIKKRPDLPFDGKNLNMALISGASTAAPYLGVDRILSGVKKYKGDLNINIYCVGRIFQQDTDLMKGLRKESSFHLLPEMDSDQLNEFFDDIHISWGSLGLHRISMRQGSVLKVNNSLSRGIPVVVAYEEMEVVNCPDYKPYILQLPATDNAVDFNRVGQFAQQVLQDPDYATTIRDLALKNTDVSVKMAKVSMAFKEHFSV